MYFIHKKKTYYTLIKKYNIFKVLQLTCPICVNMIMRVQVSYKDGQIIFLQTYGTLHRKYRKLRPKLHRTGCTMLKNYTLTIHNENLIIEQYECNITYLSTRNEPRTKKCIGDK